MIYFIIYYLYAIYNNMIYNIIAYIILNTIIKIYDNLFSKTDSLTMYYYIINMILCFLTTNQMKAPKDNSEMYPSKQVSYKSVS